RTCRPSGWSTTISSTAFDIARSPSSSDITPRDPVHDVAMAVDLGLSFDSLAEALGNALRILVQRIDQADDVIAIHRRERVLEHSARRFGCESAAPKFAPDRPSKLVLRPSLGTMKPDAAHEATGRELLDTPHAIAAQMPVSDDRGHVVP